MSKNILQYESDVWRTADLLRGCGIKESDFPKFMMPFFALVLVESRLIRESKRLEADIGKDNIDDFVEMFQLEELGYNKYVIKENVTLKDICRNDKAFEVDFQAYLEAFDPETKSLLGVNKGTEEEKYLDISGIAGQLKKKKVLFDMVKAWSDIDLTPFNNSEITTLEEHIKRKWADISASTAGEQYTPDDIIALISEIIVSKMEDNGKFITIYDPSCGGGNLLFGVEDKVLEKFKTRPTKTFGEDWNDALYALAKIESRFRADSEIRYGNTLTNISFIEKKFDVVVANPPYGVDWKGYQKAIKSDTTERFIALPSISDGQLLFAQHILYHLDKDGVAVVVHNGSTLFSGDAGSGESNIRKYFLDQDWVEAIIQMPTDEFFNTGIYTYLWIFNKTKPAKRKDKILLINASDLYVQLKKSKGKKRKEMDVDNRAKIVEAFTKFRNKQYAKVFDKWHFYYNKQAIRLTNVDVNGKSIEMPIKVNRSGEKVTAKSIILSPDKVTYKVEGKSLSIDKFEITEFDSFKFKNLESYYKKEFKPSIGKISYKDNELVVSTANASYWFDPEKETIIESSKEGQQELGCGKILVNAKFKKATKSRVAMIQLSVELCPDLEKDYEVIPFHPNERKNQKNKDDFMGKYVFKPFEYLDNVVGVEINFNKEFFEPEPLRPVKEILSDLEDLENELSILEKELTL